MACILAACLVLATLICSTVADGNAAAASSTTYKQLAPVAGQWDIVLATTKTADKSVFEPQICKEEKVSAACNHPLLTADAKDKLQVTATLKDGAAQLKTLDNLPAKKVVVKACYSKPSTVDRPWRKANEIIDKDQSCPYIIQKTDFAADTQAVNVTWPIPKNMTKAAWYATIMVQCQNGTGVSWCQSDTTKNATYFGTNIINSTPTGMIVATAVCSAIGPVFLASYFIKDFLNKRKQ